MARKWVRRSEQRRDISDATDTRTADRAIARCNSRRCNHERLQSRCARARGYLPEQCGLLREQSQYPGTSAHAPCGARLQRRWHRMRLEKRYTRRERPARRLRTGRYQRERTDVCPHAPQLYRHRLARARVSAKCIRRASIVSGDSRIDGGELLGHGDSLTRAVERFGVGQRSRSGAGTLGM